MKRNEKVKNTKRAPLVLLSRSPVQHVSETVGGETNELRTQDARAGPRCCDGFWRSRICACLSPHSRGKRILFFFFIPPHESTRMSLHPEDCAPLLDNPRIFRLTCVLLILLTLFVLWYQQKRLYEEANPNWQNDPKYKDHPKLQMLKLKKVDPDALAAANKEIAEERKKLETPAVATKSS